MKENVMLSTINPSSLNAEAAEQIAAQLDAGVLELPTSLREALTGIVAELRAGNEVTVMSSSAVLTTAEAAELLNVSRPHVVKLVDGGTIPHHMAGSHRRLALADLLAYKTQRDDASRVALAEIQQLADDTGMDL
ncbi:helix-turn-helix domain-containing protein [Ilumatobacter sp.]|uniref:helix-turn-helix domain-containing protein n=1 Tax=Ilumatobacter sp. TaxID=1967498 RepID=UPI0037534F05